MYFDSVEAHSCVCRYNRAVALCQLLQGATVETSCTHLIRSCSIAHQFHVVSNVFCHMLMDNIDLLMQRQLVTEGEKVGIMEQWTGVEQQKQKMDRHVSELQVHASFFLCMYLYIHNFMCLIS